jgi:hypothetical protein
LVDRIRGDGQEYVVTTENYVTAGKFFVVESQNLKSMILGEILEKRRWIYGLQGILTIACTLTFFPGLKIVSNSIRRTRNSRDQNHSSQRCYSTTFSELFGSFILLFDV